MIILFDQDDVLADLIGEFTSRWRTRHPDLPWIHPDRQTDFYVGNQYARELGVSTDLIWDILLEPGFISSLPPIQGGIDAFHALADAGHNVYVCTSPLPSQTCGDEKLAWVKRHLGPSYWNRLILTKDKTLVCGDILIDDKPAITGIRRPDWTQVVMDRAYNRHLTNMPRIARDWSDWRKVLAPLLTH